MERVTGNDGKGGRETGFSQKINAEQKKRAKIRCLLCNVRKRYGCLLSHIRQQHLDYNRYKCTLCAYECDSDEDRTLHHLETAHCMKFDDTKYQEHLATTIFQDCYREQFPDRCVTKKQKVGEADGRLVKVKASEGKAGHSGVRKVCGGEKSNKTIKSGVLSSVHGRNKTTRAQRTSGKRGNGPVVAKAYRKERKELQKCGTGKIKVNEKGKDDEGECSKSDSGSEIPSLADSDDKRTPGIDICTSKAPVKKSVTAGDKVSESGGKALCSSAGSSSKAIKSFIIGKSAIAMSDDDVIFMPTEGMEPKGNTHNPTMEDDSEPQTDRKIACEKCGKEVDVHYIARKAHALQFHFTQHDDPDLDELLPDAVRACFPQFLSSSDYECTECGKAIKSVGGRRTHVLKMHCFWSTTCPVPRCGEIITTEKNPKDHFTSVHGSQRLQISAGIKLKMKEIENEWKKDIQQQLNRCFPCALPKKRQISLTDYGIEVPERTLSSVLSNIIRTRPVARKRVLSSSSSSDTELSSIEDDELKIKRKRPDAMNDGKVELPHNREKIEKTEALDSTTFMEHAKAANDLNSSKSPRGLIADLKERENKPVEQQLTCALCHSKVVKKLLEYHAWTHLSKKVQPDVRLPFQCTCCVYAAYRIPDILRHAKENHGISRGNMFLSKAPQETLQLFFKKVTECFPPVKCDL